MTANEFWRKRFGEDPQTDCEKLAVAMMNMYGETFRSAEIENTPLKIINDEPDYPPINRPYTCPVCGGNGLVPNGFYTRTSEVWGTTSTVPDTCRSCNGTGIVWG